MKIYVAGKWEEKARIKEVQTELINAGHIITHDWTEEPLGMVREKAAYQDKEGVLNADALVGVFEKDLLYCGSLVEMGIAVGKGIPIYLLGENLDKRCVFMGLREVKKGIGDLLNG